MAGSTLFRRWIRCRKLITTLGEQRSVGVSIFHWWNSSQNSGEAVPAISEYNYLQKDILHHINLPGTCVSPPLPRLETNEHVYYTMLDNSRRRDWLGGRGGRGNKEDEGETSVMLRCLSGICGNVTAISCACHYDVLSSRWGREVIRKKRRKWEFWMTGGIVMQPGSQWNDLTFPIFFVFCAHFQSVPHVVEFPNPRNTKMLVVF